MIRNFSDCKFCLSERITKNMAEWFDPLTLNHLPLIAVGSNPARTMAGSIQVPARKTRTKKVFLSSER